MITEQIGLVDDILDGYRGVIGDDFGGYRNHVYRMVNFCLIQGNFDAEQKEKLAIAASFHDLGIWTADTFDYLPPSVALAVESLLHRGLTDWSAEISQMIDLHHRLRSNNELLTEVFRKGDLIDFSLGIVRCGVSADYVRSV